MSFYEVKQYLGYRLRATNEHGIHSPFVFQLYCDVIKNRSRFYAYDQLELIRGRLLSDQTVLAVDDPGSGSKKLDAHRTISSIAKLSVIPKKYGELLFRLVNHFKPSTILELGTSLGLSALYMHKAAPLAELITVEGDAETFAYAKRLISSEESEKSIVPRHMRFETFLRQETQGRNFDFIYVDGNHTYEATLSYFEQLLSHITNKTVIVFDDIYWSEGMTKAWTEIKAHPQVTLTIDLFRFGLVFFRKENKQKENFCLRY